MKKEFLKYIKLISGLFFCAVGIVTILNADLGLSPWDVLNQGLNKQMEITLGQANIGIGLIVVLIGLYFKQPLGSGTVLNVMLVGIFIDFLIGLNIIPWANGIQNQIILFIVGLIIFALGSYMYISTGCGCGPRDGLMVVLTKRTGFSVGKIRLCLETSAMIVGYFLGGRVGIGTVIFSLITGYIIQFFFKVFKQDIKQIEHRSVIKEFGMLKKFLLNR